MSPSRRRSVPTRTPRSRGRSPTLRGQVRTAGWYLGWGIWIAGLCLLLVLDFLWGFVLGLGEGAHVVRRAFAERRRNNAMKALPFEVEEAGTHPHPRRDGGAPAADHTVLRFPRGP